MQQTTDDVLTVEGVAAMLGVAPGTVYGWARRGRLRQAPGYSFSLRFLPEDVRAFAAAHPGCVPNVPRLDLSELLAHLEPAERDALEADADAVAQQLVMTVVDSGYIRRGLELLRVLEVLPASRRAAPEARVLRAITARICNLSPSDRRQACQRLTHERVSREYRAALRASSIDKVVDEFVRDTHQDGGADA